MTRDEAIAYVTAAMKENGGGHPCPTALESFWWACERAGWHKRSAERCYKQAAQERATENALRRAALALMPECQEEFESLKAELNRPDPFAGIDVTVYRR